MISIAKLKKGLLLGSVSGVLTGWLLLLINFVTNVFELESGIVSSLITFGMAGGLFGLVGGCFFALVEGMFPFKNNAIKGMVVCSSLWILFRLTGAVLSTMEPLRFHEVLYESMQGLIFSVLLGFILGRLWGWKKDAGSES